jgi:ribosomal protein S18 acetylase RimI-like enzyme
MAEIVSIGAELARERLPELVALLQDAVAGGASIGFLPPLSDVEATAYWDGIIADLASGTRVLLVAMRDGRVVGSVQLEPAGRANGAHRAEVQRLIVHRDARRQGLGRTLMDALEDHARTIGRTLLVLDTREGDPSEALYARCGYTRVGVIPRYARSATGTLDGTVYYYKHLDEEI